MAIFDFSLELIYSSKAITLTIRKYSIHLPAMTNVFIYSLFFSCSKIHLLWNPQACVIKIKDSPMFTQKLRIKVRSRLDTKLILISDQFYQNVSCNIFYSHVKILTTPERDYEVGIRVNKTVPKQFRHYRGKVSFSFNVLDKNL